MQNSTEVWKPIKNYEGFYEVSNLGNIKSLSRIVLRKGKYPFFSKEKILVQIINTRGYKRIILSVNGIKVTKIVHVLVAESFLNHNVSNTENIIVDHKNNIRHDNKLSNLQLITQRENTSKDKKNTSSKYTGVCFRKSRGYWQSAIRIEGKIKHLGYFKDELKASDAYQNALKKIQISNQIKIEI